MKYAIIETGGKQYKVKKGDKIKIELISSEKEIKEGDKVVFDKIVSIFEGEKVELGAPYLSAQKVEGKYISEEKGPKIRVQKFKSKVDRLNFDIENFVICGSTPLAIFGYCNSNDIDYLSTYDINEISDDISSHKMYAHFYKKPINELIFNPENYFYFNGIKFLTTNNIIEFKKNRGEPKDLWIIQKMNNNNKFKLIFTSIINYISLFKYKLVGQIIYLSKPLGLYNFLKEIYKFFNKPSE